MPAPMPASMATGTRRRPERRLCPLCALELQGRTARSPSTRDELRIPPRLHARPKRSTRPSEGTARSGLLQFPVSTPVYETCAGPNGQPPESSHLKRDEIRLNRHRASALCLSMISAQTRSAFVARENRYTLFRIMLQLRRSLIFRHGRTCPGQKEQRR
jgi:hypothetical protein